MNSEQYIASMEPELRARFIQMKPFFSRIPPLLSQSANRRRRP